MILLQLLRLRGFYTVEIVLGSMESLRDIPQRETVIK